jgi:hypothetical protein
MATYVTDVQLHEKQSYTSTGLERNSRLQEVEARRISTK